MRFDAVDDGVQPPAVHPPYVSTRARGPLARALRVRVPLPAERGIAPLRLVPAQAEADLTRQGSAAPLGEKIIVAGRVIDEDGAPVRDSLIEVWQCNAAGRYRHAKDRHDAPLDPNFSGWGRLATDVDGRYRLVTIKPGPYPWGNHDKAWRPAHIHLSLFGNVHAQRLVTQMYFAGDPLLAFDPIVRSIADDRARERLCARLDMALTDGASALGWRWDIVLRGRDATPSSQR